MEEMSATAISDAMTSIMSPSRTHHICFTIFAATQCLDVPTFDSIKADLDRFYHEVVLQHPYVSAAILLLWAFYPLVPFQAIWFIFWVVPKSIVLGILTFLGFEREGVRHGSIAWRYHSYTYGAINHDVESQNRRADAPQRPHPVANFFRKVIQLLLVYAVIVLLLQYGARQK